MPERAIVVRTPELDYLRLLHRDSPGSMLGEFLDYAGAEPGVSVRTENVEDGPVDFPDLLETSGEVETETEAFLRWWIEEFNEKVAGGFDSLTGLPSRDCWDRDLKGTVREDLDRFTILMMDIDHFKKINDTHGHQAGDEVLAALGEILRDHLGDVGYVVRYGGEEFLAAVELNRKSVLEQTRLIRESLATGRYFEDQSDPITLSVGVSLPAEKRSVPERIEEADLALYSSKSGGRDRTTVFAPYMRHRQQLSIWGFYRYLWKPDVRFCFGSNGDRYHLYRNGELLTYSWSDNRADRRALPSAMAHPIQRLTRSGSNTLVIDADGTLWQSRGNRPFEPVEDEGMPRFVALSAEGSSAVLVGVNNQCYTFRGSDLSHAGSFPSDWETMIYNGTVYYVVDGKLMEWDGSSGSIVTELPEIQQDFSVDDNRLVMSSTQGNLYQFDWELDHWKQLKVPDLLGEPVRVRNISHHHDSYLFKDESGRLLLARKKSKSVPQEMNLPSASGTA